MIIVLQLPQVSSRGSAGLLRKVKGHVAFTLQSLYIYVSHKYSDYYSKKDLIVKINE